MTIAELKSIKLGTLVEITFDGGKTWTEPLSVYRFHREDWTAGKAEVQAWAKPVGGKGRSILFAACEVDNDTTITRLAK